MAEINVPLKNPKDLCVCVCVYVHVSVAYIVFVYCGVCVDMQE